MSTFATFVEVEVVCPVEHVDSDCQYHCHLDSSYAPVQDILAGMRMDDIEENGQSHLVSLVNEGLELFGGA
jgi:hypothetical protein